MINFGLIGLLVLEAVALGFIIAVWGWTAGLIATLVLFLPGIFKEFVLKLVPWHSSTKQKILNFMESSRGYHIYAPFLVFVIFGGLMAYYTRYHNLLLTIVLGFFSVAYVYAGFIYGLIQRLLEIKRRG